MIISISVSRVYELFFIQRVAPLACWNVDYDKRSDAGKITDADLVKAALTEPP